MYNGKDLWREINVDDKKFEIFLENNDELKRKFRRISNNQVKELANFIKNSLKNCVINDSTQRYVFITRNIQDLLYEKGRDKTEIRDLRTEQLFENADCLTANVYETSATEGVPDSLIIYIVI